MGLNCGDEHRRWLRQTIKAAVCVRPPYRGVVWGSGLQGSQNSIEELGLELTLKLTNVSTT